MKTSVKREGSKLTVAPQERIDTITAPELDQIIAAELGDATELVLDFADVNYISSAGLRVLLTYAQEMENRNGTIQGVNVGERVHDVFDMTGFLEILNVE